MLLLTIRFFASAYTKNNNFQCSYDNKSKKEKSWLLFVVIDVHSVLKSGLSTSEKRLNFESTLQPTKVYHVILWSRDI